MAAELLIKDAVETNCPACLGDPDSVEDGLKLGRQMYENPHLTCVDSTKIPSF